MSASLMVMTVGDCEYSFQRCVRQSVPMVEHAPVQTHVPVPRDGQVQLALHVRSPLNMNGVNRNV
jgi:hypothetical protein